MNIHPKEWLRMEILNTFRTSISSATMLLRQVDQDIVIMKMSNKASNIIELILGNVQLNKKRKENLTKTGNSNMK